MKIGMMADVYKTQVSGVTNSITLMKRWLEKLGHDVYVFTFGDEEVIDEEKNIIRTPGVPLVDTGIYVNLRYNNDALRVLYTMDIVHVHHPFLSGSLAMRYCAPKNIPIVFTNHTRYDLYARAYLPLLPEQIEEAAIKAYLAPFFRVCDLVIVPSPSMRKVMEKHFGLDSPVEVIPHGLELAPFSTVSNPIDRSTLGFCKSDIIAIYVGRLASEKNISLLLRAFYGVASTYDNVRLLIVGDGPDRENLEDQAARMKIHEKVHFTGMIDYKNVPAYLAGSDIFVTPSITETFGLSTVEAMAAGLPVLGIDAPGTTDIIENGVSGLVSSNDLEVFTVKLARLATDTALREKLGKGAFQASQKYDIQATIAILVKKYEQLVEIARQKKKNKNQNIPGAANSSR